MAASIKELEERIEMALGVITSAGGIDGSHHKQWVLDQVVRYLTGCPLVAKEGVTYNGKKYLYETPGESEEYLQWIRAYCDGEDGPNTYDWDTGIAP